MKNYSIIDYRFATTKDLHDKKYLENWSRPYEYKYVTDFILNYKKGTPKIHNTSCGGHHEVHNIFRRELDKIGDCIHSDAKVSQPLKTVHYDITKENPEYFEKFDFVLNVSTIEHLPDKRLQAIENLFKQVKPGGYLVMTFDYPKVSRKEMYQLLHSSCAKPVNCLTGKTSVSPNMNDEFNHEVIYLVIQKTCNDIAILVDESSLFAAPFLAEAIECPLYVMYHELNDFFGHGVRGINWENGTMIHEKNLIVIGYNALKALNERKLESNFSTMALILSDSWTCKYHKWLNEYIEKYEVPVYCTPDLQKYLKSPAIPAYQTLKLKYNNLKKPKNKLIVSHSPSGAVKFAVKGSGELIEIINRLKKKYDFEFRLITNLKMDDCIRLKGESHIFVDMFNYQNKNVPQDRFGGEIWYDGSLGKAGLEAMRLGCCTITAAPEPDTDKYFPAPPAIWCNVNNFEKKFIKVLENENYRREIAKKQYDWVHEFTSPEFVAKHITQHL